MLLPSTNVNFAVVYANLNSLWKEYIQKIKNKSKKKKNPEKIPWWIEKWGTTEQPDLQ